MLKYYLSNINIIPLSFNNQIEINTLTTTDPVGTEIIKSRTVNNSTAIIAAYALDITYSNLNIDIGNYIFSTYAKADILGNGISQIIASIFQGIDGAGTVTVTGTGTTRTVTASTGTPFVAADENIDITYCSYVRTPQGQYPINGYVSPTVVTIETPPGYINETAVAFVKYSYVYRMTVGDIITTDLDLYTPVTSNDTTISAIDGKLEIIYFAKTSRISDTLVSFSYNGTEHVSTVTTPFVFYPFISSASPHNLTGTTNQINLSVSGVGAILARDIQLSTPQDIGTSSSPTFNSLILSEAITAPLTVNSSQVVTNFNADELDGHHASDFELSITKYDLSGTTNQISLSASGTGVLFARNIQLSLPQDIATSSSPTFANLTATTGINVGAATSAPIGTVYAYDNIGHGYFGQNNNNKFDIASSNTSLKVNNVWSFIWRTTTFSPYDVTVTVNLGAALIPWNKLYLKNQLVSTLADGTAPFSVTSTTKVSNLQADSVDGVNIAALTSGRLLRYNSTGTQIENATVTETSGALGSVTTIGMSGQLTSTLAIGTAPFAVTSTTENTNFNANYLQGHLASYFATAAGVNAVRTIYVGKHGNDTNSGLNWNNALLTIGAAITLANTLTPTYASPVAIYVIDAGTYTEGWTLASGTFCIAPYATLVGQLVITRGANLICWNAYYQGNDTTTTITISGSVSNVNTYLEIRNDLNNVDAASYAPNGILISTNSCNKITIKVNRFYYFYSSAVGGAACKINCNAAATTDLMTIEVNKAISNAPVSYADYFIYNTDTTYGQLNVKIRKAQNNDAGVAHHLYYSNVANAVRFECDDFGGGQYSLGNGAIMHGHGGYANLGIPSRSSPGSDTFAGYKILNVYLYEGTAAVTHNSKYTAGTMPTTAGGAQYDGFNYYPRSNSSILLAIFCGTFSVDIIDNITIGIFETTTSANSIAWTCQYMSVAYGSWPPTFLMHAITNSSLAMRTFTLRAGNSNAGSGSTTLQAGTTSRGSPYCFYIIELQAI